MNNGPANHQSFIYTLHYYPSPRNHWNVLWTALWPSSESVATLAETLKWGKSEYFFWKNIWAQKLSIVVHVGYPRGFILSKLSVLRKLTISYIQIFTFQIFFRMLILMSQVMLASKEDNELIKQFRSHAMKLVHDSVLPNCVWKAGR